VTKSLAILLGILFLLVCAAAIISCGADEEVKRSFDETIDIGKRYLMANQGALAAEAFTSARAMRPESTDANFGLMLGNTMQFINLIDEISGLVGAFLYETPPIPETGELGVLLQAQELQIGDYIKDFFNETVDKSFDENEVIFQDLEKRKDFIFNIESYPIVFGGQALLLFGGEFDKTDLYLFGAFTSLLNAVMDIVQALDLNFDINAIVIPTLDFTNDPIGSIQSIIDLLRTLLRDPDYPNFLMVEGEEGLIGMKEAGIDFGNVFERLALIFDQLATETDNQADDQIRYDDVNKNGRFDPQTDPVQIDSTITLDAGLAPILQQLFVELSYAFWEGSPRDPHPNSVDTLNLGMLNDLLIYLDVLSQPILPDDVGVDVGSFFSHPTEDGLRSLLLAIADLVNLLLAIIDDQAAGGQNLLWDN